MHVRPDTSASVHTLAKVCTRGDCPGRKKRMVLYSQSSVGHGSLTCMPHWTTA